MAIVKKETTKKIRISDEDFDGESMTELSEPEVLDLNLKDSKADFTGKYISAIGRRKTATASIRLFENGKGIIIVNDLKINKYFTPTQMSILSQPLKLAGRMRDFNFSIIVSGGGKDGQAEAVRHGITRTLVKMDENYRAVMKTADLLTRDRREVERKKPGHRKARKSAQWSKR